MREDNIKQKVDMNMWIKFNRFRRQTGCRVLWIPELTLGIRSTWVIFFDEMSRF